MKTPPCFASSGSGRLGSVFPLLAVLAAGFAVRLYASMNTGIVNQDGPLYIYQAKAIWRGQWDHATSCGLSYISVYSVLIAAARAVFHDWVNAARAVSVLFGTLVIVPVYFLLRRFFDRSTSLLSVLVLALIPTLVDSSVELVKDPVSWFFAASGLLFFVTHLEGREGLRLVLSGLFFLAAAAARIEAAAFLLASCVYLVFAGEENKIYKLFCFLLPVALFVPAAALIAKGIGNPPDAFRLSEVAAKASAPLEGYHRLRLNLDALIHRPVMDTLQFFLERARQLIWFIALSALASFLIKAFFYPFFFLFLLGLKGIGEKVRRDPRIVFLFFSSLCIFALLYVHTIQTWIMAPRFLVLVMLPAFVGVGFGLENLLHFLTGRLRMKTPLALVIMFSLVAASSLPKDLKPRESDKIVFRQVAECIRDMEHDSRAVSVASSLHLLRWISFYANIHAQDAACPQPYMDFEHLVGSSYDEFVRNLRKEEFEYFVWEEKRWPQGAFDFRKRIRPEDFTACGSWTHPDSGRIVLYRISP